MRNTKWKNEEREKDKKHKEHEEDILEQREDSEGEKLLIEKKGKPFLNLSMILQQC